MGTGKFALIGHPLDMEQYRGYIKHLKPGKSYKDKLLLKLFEWTPSYKIKEWKNYSLDQKSSVDGMMIMVPFLPEMRDIKLKKIREKIEGALAIASEGGCTVAAMGAFTSIIIQGQEEELSKKYGLQITSGNSNTTAIICQSITNITKNFGIPLSKCTLAIIGASGDIGSGCLQYFSERVKKMNLTSRGIPQLKKMVEQLRGNFDKRVNYISDNHEAIRNANIVICATSSHVELFNINDFQAGTIVCDASAPLNVRLDNLNARKDVFLYHGGIAAISNPINLGFNIGLASPYTLYGCLLEGILISTDPSLPKSHGRGNITPAKIEAYVNRLKPNAGLKCVFSVGNHIYTEKELKAYEDKFRKQEY